jgi:hypothetical protein
VTSLRLILARDHPFCPCCPLRCPDARRLLGKAQNVDGVGSLAEVGWTGHNRQPEIIRQARSERAGLGPRMGLGRGCKDEPPEPVTVRTGRKGWPAHKVKAWLPNVKRYASGLARPPKIGSPLTP